MNSAEPGQPGQQIIADLRENGGGTYTCGTLAAFTATDGYAVGIGGPQFTLDAFEALGPDGVAALLRQVASEASTMLVGTWLNEGIVYLDAVLYFDQYDARGAVRAAYEYGQKAVYHFGSGEALRPGQITFDQ